MKIAQITESKLEESIGTKIYVALADVEYEGTYPIQQFEATSDLNYAKQQAEKLAADRSDDTDIVIVAFVDGVNGFSEAARVKGGVDISAEVAKHGDKYETDPEYSDMSDNMKQLSRQGR